MPVPPGVVVRRDARRRAGRGLSARRIMPTTRRMGWQEPKELGGKRQKADEVVTLNLSARLQRARRFKAKWCEKHLPPSIGFALFPGRGIRLVPP